MIDAAAGVGERLQAPDLDVVARPAARADAEGGEDRLVRFEARHLQRVGLAPPPPQLDLVLVAGAPPRRSRPVEDGFGLAARLGSRRWPAVGARRIPDHG